MKKSLFTFGLLLLLASLVLTACGAKPAPVATQPAAATQAPVVTQAPVPAATTAPTVAPAPAQKKVATFIFINSLYNIAH